MKTFNKKPLFLAIAGVSALGVAGAAQAISVSPTGTGQVLVYPYYTVKTSAAGNQFNTLLSVVNTTASTKAVKIRFREGKASAEVLDFNIFLSPEDVWVGMLQPVSGGGVNLTTPDKTCTIPTIPSGGVQFRTANYETDAVKDASLTRLMEGYFEVFEMATFTDGSVTAVNSRHTAAGVPKDCSKVTDATALAEQQPVQGGLTGSVSIVAPGGGLNVAANPVALANFRAGANYQSTASDLPNFSQTDLWSVSPAGTDGQNVVYATWPVGRGVDAATAAMTAASIINEFVLDTATASTTDWIVTFPTKHHYVPSSGALPTPPFASRLSPTGSCDPISLTTWNREEAGVTPSGADFSPVPIAQGVTLCWEANIVTFNGKNAAGSSNTLGVNTNFQNGWAQIGFQGSSVWNGTSFSTVTPNPLVASTATIVNLNPLLGAVPSSVATSTTFAGLPVVGFAVNTFRPSATASYAGTLKHKTTPSK